MKDEVKLKFYTGLPSFQVFQLIQNAIDDSLSSLKFTAIDNFQMLLLTLMKLRMNSSFRDLGYRFGIRADSASLIFKKVIIFLYHALNEFIIWPSRDAAKVLIPACFRNNFGDKFAIILECFEVSTQKPSSLRANQQSFSNYSGTNTVKYLIGITPHGVVSFVSKGYEGRVSDRVITEDCGILKNLLPGDVVLVDQGFTINELVAETQTVKVPDSNRSQAQLQPSPVENTRTIASVRIHVERIIGEIRNKYAIMNGPISIELLRNMYQNERLLDFIVKVCCILANFCDSIVPIGE
ncbi:uncharacterized protein LOC135837802 [Planococcus citri]|uniref:uncharacterized protein LOC135837802 n=1 Tax=Planococcus citri TaxID=170843 RepID=UPI0031F9B28C